MEGSNLSIWDQGVTGRAPFMRYVILQASGTSKAEKIEIILLRLTGATFCQINSITSISILRMATMLVRTIMARLCIMRGTILPSIRLWTQSRQLLIQTFQLASGTG